MTLVAGWGRNHVFFTTFDHVPEPDEYFHAGRRITQAMLSKIGQYPTRWQFVPSSEFIPERAAEILKRDPVRVA